jgi:nucleotide sugar dehydrogenase
MRIGIIGHGYVGQAVAQAHKHSDEIIIKDPKYPDSASYTDLVGCDGIYVCVPSPCVDPTLEDGRCDTTILEQVLRELLFVLIDKQIPIICKTTAPPSVYVRLQEQYPNIVHVPEFLTAANNIADYQTAEYQVMGGHPNWTSKAEVIVRRGRCVNPGGQRFVNVPIQTAALFKYMMNSYLAMKVTFMNEFKQLADTQGTSWNDIKYLLTLDNRIGQTHINVPGSDGQKGWGGACFPKDVAAIITEAIDKGLDFNLMQEVEAVNKIHRKL